MVVDVVWCLYVPLDLCLVCCLDVPYLWVLLVGLIVFVLFMVFGVPSWRGFLWLWVGVLK